MLSVLKGDVDPEVLLTILADGSQDAASPQRLIAILTFSAWMHWPNDKEVLNHARVVAAANVLVSEKLTAVPGLGITDFSRALVDFPLTTSYENAYEHDDMSRIADLISFFIHCPIEEKPSFLKACFFIDECGLLEEGIPPEEQKYYKRSPATSKLAWRDQLAAGPCIYADGALEDEIQNIYNFAPDHLEAVGAAKKYLLHPTLLTEFLQTARFCQERLVDRLDPKSLERVKFPRFPETVKAKDPGFATFDERQLKILRRYRAPTAIDSETQFEE